MRFFMLSTFIVLSSAYEHWFIFDKYQFPGFHTPLFTLISSSNNKSNVEEQKQLSFALSTYERSIILNVSSVNSTKEMNRNSQLIKLNIERADLLYNSLNHLIFLVVKEDTKLETYVNCKLIDSYILYSSYWNNNDENDDDSSPFIIENLADGIKHLESSIDEHYHQQVFDKFGCKQAGAAIIAHNKTLIGKPLIRKMQHVIEKVQKRKQRPRRHQNQKSFLELNSDSFTVIYKPNIGQKDDNESYFRNILNVPQIGFHIRYYPKEHLFNIRFNNENRTQFILYADKSTDRLASHQNNSNDSVSSNNLLSTVMLFLHITPTMITCYVNCELTDQEFIIDSFYVQNIIRQMTDRTINNKQNEEKYFIEYDRQSTLILFNKSIDHIAAGFFCLKLDKKNEDLLPDKYTLRKFANALDILVNSLEAPLNLNNHHDQTSTTSTTTSRSISAVNIHTIDGFGSLVAPSLNNDINTIQNDINGYDKSCHTDQDCSSGNSFLVCQQNHCVCPTRYFWSPNLHRCVSCKDLSIGNRCFRLSNHKSTWYETNDYCQDESSSDDQGEYRMRLASNLNRTDIELLRHGLMHDDDGEQLDYFYWIGATSQFETKKVHAVNYRLKRHVPTTIFRWYDNGETTQLNIPDIWCSQKENMNRAMINNNELCVTLTSCGLYADDCQRNYRFLCEAV